jgi:hypothetical protein
MYYVFTILNDYGKITIREITKIMGKRREAEGKSWDGFEVELNRNKRIISHYCHEYRYCVLEKMDGKGFVRLRKTDRVKHKLQRLLKDKEYADLYGWKNVRRR